MRRCILLITTLATRLAIAQVMPSATGSISEMETPPPVSGAAYPIGVRADMRTNYLQLGIAYTSAYINNLYPSGAGTPLAETTQAVFPTMTFETTTARQHLMADYSPGFTFYSPTSSLNVVEHSGGVNYNIRLTPHTSVTASDQLEDGSFGTYAETGGTVSGAPPSSTPGAVPPYSRVITNSAEVGVTEQTGLNTMIGASGLSTTLHYLNSSQSTDLGDSSSRGGAGFYNKRVSRTQYVGGIYQYLDMLTYLANDTSTTSTSAVLGYYSVYLKPGLSLSISGGTQHYHVSYPEVPTLAGWSPSVTASMGWQGNRTSFAANYSQSVTGGGGLVGAYHSRTAALTAGWRMARSWTGGVSAGYTSNENVDRAAPTEGQGGHGLTGAATLQHPIRAQLAVGFSYQHFHQSYEETAIASNPNSDRVSLTITWTFQRPLGR